MMWIEYKILYTDEEIYSTVDCDDLEKNKEDDGCKVQVENCKMLKSLAKKSLGSFVSAESLLAQQGALRQMGVNQVT